MPSYLHVRNQQASPEAAVAAESLSLSTLIITDGKEGVDGEER